MQAELTRFTIEGLHNMPTIDIPIENNKLILSRKNGASENSVANFIYFFLTSQWSQLLANPFNNISYVINGEKIIFDRQKIAKAAKLTPSTSNGTSLIVEVLNPDLPQLDALSRSDEMQSEDSHKLILCYSDEEESLEASAVRILCREMGVVKATRVIQKLTTGYGDYVTERDQIIGDMTVDNITAEIKKRRQANEGSNPPAIL